MGFIKEFREFALKGNVLDLAVGLIIGAAFGKIVNSMVNDILMPVVAIAGKRDFSNMYFGLTQAVRDKRDEDPTLSLQAARDIGPVFAYGNFITEVINFTILAFCVFLVIKLFNTARKRFEAQEKAVPAPLAPPTNEEKLLSEIRDLLKQRA